MSCRHPTTPGAGEQELAIFVLGSPHGPAFLRDRSNTQLGEEPLFTEGKFSLPRILFFLVYFLSLLFS
jgi:hypothetical protein